MRCMDADSTGLDSNSEIHLRRVLENGSAILFTGAGFSAGALNRQGEELLVGSALRTELWSLAFPGQAYEDDASLGDLFDAAMRTARSATEARLRELFTVDASSLPELYADYLRLPWYRIYTLNIDDLIDATQRRFDLPFEIVTLSALRDELPPPDKLSAVHLNGRLSDLPEVTFSPLQYGQRTSGLDLVYPQLVRELATHSTVFIGTQLEEPTFWHHVALRGPRSVGRELRPKSYIVTPRLSTARAAMLDQFNVKHVPMTAAQFWEAFVQPAVSKPHVRLAGRSSLGSPFESVALSRSRAVEAPADFLLGREPDWGDLDGGFAVTRAFEDRAVESMKRDSPKFVALTGTAGSGKSTSLRRLALEALAEGEHVLWLRAEASHTMAQIRAAAVAESADLVVIDQAERFGRRGIDLVLSLLDSDIRVMAAYSATKFDDMGVESALRDYRPLVVETPLLTDEDIDSLLDALTRANRLGRLSGIAREAQFAAVKDRAGRQLLVAMLEATSGERFEEKVARECTELAAELATAYAVTALATSHRYSLSREDLLASMSDVTSEGLSVIDRLLRQHLLLKMGTNGLVLRHPVIAREVVSHYRSSGQLSEAISRLAFVMASKFDAGRRRTPERRLLTNLISHEYLGQTVGSVHSVRALYQDLEALLREDADYWLQRGSYELERGDIHLAENFLAQARNLSQGSVLVQTEWAYLMLKRAVASPSDVRSVEWANEGIAILLDVIDRSGKSSPHTYVVLAREVIAWASVGVISPDDKRLLFTTVRSALKAGSAYHSGNRYFRDASKDLEAAYLSLAL